MGNCLVIQDRREIIKIMSMDGGSEALKVPSPRRLMMKVHDDSLCEPQSLPAASVLPPVKAPAGTVRVKLVISKRELKKMLDKEGMSLDDVVSLVRKETSDHEQECCGGWRPALESIPEGSDLWL